MTKNIMQGFLALALLVAVTGTATYLFKTNTPKHKIAAGEEHIATPMSPWVCVIKPDLATSDAIREVVTGNHKGKTARLTLTGLQPVEGCPYVEVCIGGLEIQDGYVGSYSFYPVSDKTPRSAYFDLTQALIARHQKTNQHPDSPIEIYAWVSGGKDARTRIGGAILEIVE